MACGDYCTLRKEVVETGEGVWFAMTLGTGEEAVVRLHRVNVVAGECGPAIQVVRRDAPGEVWTVALACIREIRFLGREQGA
jgi:hypothetical protein